MNNTNNNNSENFTCSQCGLQQANLYHSAVIDGQDWCESCFSQYGAICREHGVSYVCAFGAGCRDCAQDAKQAAASSR